MLRIVIVPASCDAGRVTPEVLLRLLDAHDVLVTNDDSLKSKREPAGRVLCTDPCDMKDPRFAMDIVNAVQAAGFLTEPTVLMITDVMRQFAVLADGTRVPTSELVNYLSGQMVDEACDCGALGLLPEPPAVTELTDALREDWNGSWATCPVWAISVAAVAGGQQLKRRHVAGLYATSATSADEVTALAGEVTAAVRMPALEVPPVFNEKHYPKGVNANFAADVDSLVAKFTGNQGLFEGAEGRELAARADSVVALINGLLEKEEANSDSRSQQRILELGCGTGLFTAKLARREDSFIVATDPSSGFIRLVDDRRRTWPSDAASRVVLHHTPTDALPSLPRGCITLTAIIDVYHHLEYPLSVMRDVHRATADGGLVLLIDFHRDVEKHYSHPHDPQWILDHVRADQQTFEAEIERCGFQKLRDIHIDGLRENYVSLFKKSTTIA